MEVKNYKEILDKLNIDYSKVINSTLDIKNDSILCIDHRNVEKLDNLVSESLKKGVKYILTSSNCSVNDSKLVKFDDYNLVFESILNYIYEGYKNLKYFGITGTNGKTTSAFYLKQLLGNNSLFVGTTDQKSKYPFTEETVLTTPKIFNLVKLISIQNKKIDSIVLEVSSHALDQNRLGNLEFEITGFTNLSQDHLDYHKSMENYLDAKSKLFQKNKSKKFVYIDSIYAKKLVANSNIESFSIGYDSKNDVILRNFSNNNLEFTIDNNDVKLNLKLIGPKSIENFLLAFGMAYYSNTKDLLTLIKNSSGLINPQGRYEKIETNNNLNVIVDFAHTPLAIEEVIKYSKSIYKKVLVILGAGGNRDRSKRNLMGKAASYADSIFITNDNPRNENPLEIANSILEGIPLNKNVEVILDRQEAISKAISLLKDDEVLLILGKGHEKTQEFQNELIPFDDVLIAKNIMENL